MPYEDKIPQRFRGNFMSQQLDYTTSYNQHDTLSGSYQYGGTQSLSNGNLIGRTIKGGRYFSGLYRWSWQHFRGKVEASLWIATLYKAVPPTTGVGAGSVYADPDSAIETSCSAVEGFMVALIALVSNIGNLRIMWVFNGHIGRICGVNENGYSGPLHKKICFLYFPSSILILKISPCAHEGCIRNISFLVVKNI